MQSINDHVGGRTFSPICHAGGSSEPLGHGDKQLDSHLVEKQDTVVFFFQNPLVLTPSSANCFQKREPRSLHMFWLGMPNLNCCRSQKCTRGLRTWCGVFSWGSFCSGCMWMLNAPIDRHSLFLRFSLPSGSCKSGEAQRGQATLCRDTLHIR